MHQNRNPEIKFLIKSAKHEIELYMIIRITLNYFELLWITVTEGQTTQGNVSLPLVELWMLKKYTNDMINLNYFQTRNGILFMQKAVYKGEKCELWIELQKYLGDIIFRLRSN